MDIQAYRTALRQVRTQKQERRAEHAEQLDMTSRAAEQAHIHTVLSFYDGEINGLTAALELLKAVESGEYQTEMIKSELDKVSNARRKVKHG